MDRGKPITLFLLLITPWRRCSMSRTCVFAFNKMRLLLAYILLKHIYCVFMYVYFSKYKSIRDEQLHSDWSNQVPSHWGSLRIHWLVSLRSPWQVYSTPPKDRAGMFLKHWMKRYKSYYVGVPETLTWAQTAFVSDYTSTTIRVRSRQIRPY